MQCPYTPLQQLITKSFGTENMVVAWPWAQNSPDFKSTRPPANHSLFRYCWQTPWLWDSKIAIHHIQEETATEDRIFIMNLAIVYKLYLGIKNIRFEESLSYSSIVPRRENNIKGIHWLWTSKWNRKAATHGFPIASSIPYVVEFGPIWFPTEASWSCHTS